MQKLFKALTKHSVKVTAISGLFVHVGRPLISLITMPLLLEHLGQEGLGIWMIALSLMTLVGFMSTGLSASIVTLVGRANNDTKAYLSKLTTASSLVAVIIGLLILTITLPLAIIIDWAERLSLQETISSSDIAMLMATLAILLSFGFVATIPRQVMVGRLQGYLAYLLDFFGIVVGAALLFVAVGVDAPLWVLGAAFIAPTYISYFFGGLIYLRKAGISFADRRYFDREILISVARDSLRMGGYQGAYAVSTHSDLFLIGLILGAPASAAYGVAQRIFSIPILVSLIVNHAQWPAMARADASGDIDLISRVLRPTLILGSGFALIVAITIAAGYDSILMFWLKDKIDTEPAILIGMVIWVLIATAVNTCDSVLRARNDTAFLLRAMLTMATLNLTITISLLHIIGPSGAIWGSILGFTFGLLIPYTFRIRAFFLNAKEKTHAE
jgi:O-antigen/teichoic acid export membrane protein